MIVRKIFYNFNVSFATIETTLVMGSKMMIVAGETKRELNLTELELAFRKSNSIYSRIPKDWCILDNKSTVNVF